MNTRLLSLLLLLAVGGGLLAASRLAGTPPPVQCVRPTIGTSAHGHVYPGATVPFGMVQLSPDTRLETWDGCSGYHWSDSAILGFSHTHLSGTGCPDLGDIRLIPLSGPFEPPKEKGRYRFRFSHDRETARAGYYRVVLDDPQIEVELTATSHAGFHRYTFPADKPAHLALDLIDGIGNTPIEASLTIENNTRLSGYRRSKGFAADKTYYFVAEISRPFETSGLEVDGKPAQNPRQAKGARVRAHVSFPASGEPILVKVGLSAVSIDGARKNLAAEIPGWDFTATAAAAKRCWSDLLGCIQIETNDTAVRETFYTALYHAALTPTLFNDADGAYRGADRQVHPNPDFQNYSTFSLWDTFRAEHALLAIVQPQRVDDFVNSMLAHYRHFKQHALPVWPLAGNETWCMIGNHAIPVIAEAYAKGFRGFDAEAAYQAMRDTVSQNRDFLDEYRRLGYVSSADEKQSVSRTLEYAYDDWCVARMARLLGKTDDATVFSKRAQNFRNVFDPSVGFVRGKTPDGTWRTPFDPRQWAIADFTEGTAWNYTFFVPHDVPALIRLLGGPQAFVAKLDAMFDDQTALVSTIRDLTGRIGQYIQGNEPCHHIAYLYAYAGAPWKTQQRVRQIMTTLYKNTPDGLCGNEDCGQMSAWYVFSALGFYPVNPASGVYILGSPLVDRATIQLDPRHCKGRTFTVVAENNAPENVYIQSATLNGKPLERSWFTHAELTAGGELVLKMGPQPNAAWAQQPENRPPAH